MHPQQVCRCWKTVRSVWCTRWMFLFRWTSTSWRNEPTGTSWNSMITELREQNWYIMTSLFKFLLYVLWLKNRGIFEYPHNVLKSNIAVHSSMTDISMVCFSCKNCFFLVYWFFTQWFDLGKWNKKTGIVTALSPLITHSKRWF